MGGYLPMPEAVTRPWLAFTIDASQTIGSGGRRSPLHGHKHKLNRLAVIFVETVVVELFHLMELVTQSLVPRKAHPLWRPTRQTCRTGNQMRGPRLP